MKRRLSQLWEGNDDVVLVTELLTPETSRAGQALESRFWSHSLLLKRGKVETGSCRPKVTLRARV